MQQTSKAMSMFNASLNVNPIHKQEYYLQKLLYASDGYVVFISYVHYIIKKMQFVTSNLTSNIIQPKIN